MLPVKRPTRWVGELPVNPFADMGIADVPPAGGSVGIMYGVDSRETLKRGSKFGIAVNPFRPHLLQRFVVAEHAADDFDVMYVEVRSANGDHKVQAAVTRVHKDGSMSYELREPLVVKAFDWVELRVCMKKDARVTLTAVAAEPPVEAVTRAMVRNCKEANPRSERYALWEDRVEVMTDFEAAYKRQRRIE